MYGFDHHGWLQLPNWEGQMRDATLAEAAGEYDHQRALAIISRLPEPRASDIDHEALARELTGYDYAAHQRRHDEMWGRIKVALMIFVLGVAFIAGVITAARRADNGQWKDLPPSVREWFQSPKIKPCCALADGTRTEWEIKDGGYYGPVPWHPPGHEYWERVPDNAIITSEGNPVGQALIWYGPNFIRCFVPGGGG